MQFFEEDRARGDVVGVWMTGDEGIEEKEQEATIQKLTEGQGKEFRLFKDEKYYVDE